MKKILGLAIAFAFTLSLSACTTRNNRINYRNQVGDNTGITTRRLSGTNDNFSTINNYKDGVYTSYGNAHRNGNERAVVQIRNGRIVNIDLTTINQQGATNNTTGNRVTTGTTGTIPGTRIDNQTGNELTRGNLIGNGNMIGSENMIGSGGINTQGNLQENTTGDTAGYRNIPNNTIDNRTNLNGNGLGGTMGTPVGSTLNGVKTNLVNAMIQQQSYDVNIANNDTTLTTTINNWKLAVQRALQQARK